MLKLFKITALLEGISYIVLFANMLVIKNINLELYKTFLFPIGMAHGLLFIAYLVLATVLKMDYKWDIKKYLVICIASVIPFGAFWIEAKYVNDKQSM